MNGLDVDQGVTDLLSTVKIYAFPFWAENSNPESIIDLLESKKFSLDPLMRTMRLCCALSLSGRSEEGKRQAVENLELLTGRNDMAAEMFREFAKRYLVWNSKN